MGGLEVRLTDLRSVLCLGAHADDIEIGCGGTVLRLLEENQRLEVHWIVLSAPDERSTEARDSANLMLDAAGLANIRVADFRETYFPYVGDELKAYVGKLGSELAPDVIFTHWREDLHQDHRMVSELTWNTFRNHLILEYEIPKYDGDLGIPNLFVPLEEAYITKRNAIIIESFVSQKEKHWFDDATFRALPRLRGMESASLYAEAFYARKIIL